jgi:hypothetical protein
MVPSLDTCTACIVVKVVHLPHKEGQGHVSEYLKRVHINIVGPVPTKSVGRREYAHIIVDDYTHTVYTRLLQLKSEAVNAFKTFQVVVENESGSKLHAMMTDNTCELLIGEVHNICKWDGIKLHTTIPYHPALNGVAEHTIGVLTSAARTMLYDSSLPDYLWAEEINTATYVHNRTPTKVGMKPDPVHFTVVHHWRS